MKILRSLLAMAALAAVLFAALPATDNFNRTDANPIDGTWAVVTAGADLAIVTNKFKSDTASTTATARWTADSADPDQYSQVLTDADSCTGPAVRVSAVADTEYGAAGGCSASTIFVNRIIAGVATEIATRSEAFASAKTVRLEVTGTGATVTLKVFVDGVQNGADITDTSGDRILSGDVGITGYSTNGAGGDNWEGGNLGGTPARRRFVIF